MEDTIIYLDHNATTPIAPQVAQAMWPYLTEHFGNPSSNHALGRRAREAVEQARGQVAALLHAAPDHILFTSGGTESNNLAICGLVMDPARRRVVSSVIEHPATLEPCRQLARQGVALDLIGADEAGRWRLDALEAALRQPVGLVTLMHSHNETGALQPIAEAAALLRAHPGALLHTDAAQSVGKVAIDVEALGVDMLTVAGHKLYAPKGVGALYVRPGTPLAPLVRGAGQERGLRPGTEDVASIVGLGAAAQLAAERLASGGDRALSALRDDLWARLSAQIPGLRRYGLPDATLPNTLYVSFPGVIGQALLAACPQLAASTASACHDGHHKPSAALLAMGVPAEQALGAARLTLGYGNDAAQLARAADALITAWRVSAARSA